jgi:hypothetical protein
VFGALTIYPGGEVSISTGGAAGGSIGLDGVSFHV